MGRWNRGAKLACTLVVCFLALAASAQTRKELTFNVGPGASVNIQNDLGPITVHSGSGQQVLVTTTLRSDKVQIDQSQTGQRIELRTRMPQGRPAGDAARVDYDVTVPANCSISVRTVSGPITIERLQGDVTAESDTSNIDVRNTSNGHVHLRTMTGTVTLSNITNGHVEVTSVGGPVTLNDVSGARVEVNTTNGRIAYTGAFAGSGDYLFSTHTGDIDVALPASASLDISARSIRGNVENDFPFQPKTQAAFASANQGRTFSGTSNQGSASVQLRSFSGKIRVKKQ